MSTQWDECVSVHRFVFGCVYLRRAALHIELGGDDALLAENSGYLVHLTTFHCLHQPVIILVPVCVLTMMTVSNQYA